MTHTIVPAKFLISFQEKYFIPVGFNISGKGYEVIFIAQAGYSVFSQHQFKTKHILHGREAYEQQWIGAN